MNQFNHLHIMQKRGSLKKHRYLKIYKSVILTLLNSNVKNDFHKFLKVITNLYVDHLN